MSRKFSTAQHNYHIFEMETLAILEALLKWEDKLIRNHLHMVTDHWHLNSSRFKEALSIAKCSGWNILVGLTIISIC